MPRSLSLLVLASLILAVGGVGWDVGASSPLEPGVPNLSQAGVTPDTLEGIDRATQLIRNHYRGAGRSASARGNRMAGTLDRYCSGGEGSVCHGGDPDRGECNANAPCHPNEEWFVEGLLEEARKYPTSGFLMGQAIYALTKFGRLQEAEDLVLECKAEGWWCEALQGGSQSAGPASTVPSFIGLSPEITPSCPIPSSMSPNVLVPTERNSSTNSRGGRLKSLISMMLSFHIIVFS